MTLLPYPKRLERLEKALRHYLNPRERWWEVTSTNAPFEEWRQLWTVVRTSGLLVEDGWQRIAPGTPADDAANQAHDRWFQAAVESYKEAHHRNTCFFVAPGRRAYVSSKGVKVIATTEPQPALVTAYRVKIKGCSYLTDAERADELVLRREQLKAGQRYAQADQINQRAAVRRSLRYASLVQPMFAADKEEC